MKGIILLLFVFRVGFTVGQSSYYHTININAQPISLNGAFATDTAFFFAGGANGKCFAMRTDTNGAAKWVKTFGAGSANDAFIDYSGNLIVCGDMQGYGIISLSSIGNIIWQYHFFYSPGYVTSAIQLNDSSYIVEGTNTSGVVFARLSAAGIPVSTISPQSSLSSGKLVATTDGGFASLNANYPIIPDSLSFVISKYDTGANLLWARQYAYHDSISISAFATAGSNGFVMAGTVNDTVSGNEIKAYMLMRLDSAGNVLWSNYYWDNIDNSFASLNSVVQTMDGGFLACGTVDADTDGYNILSFKIDSAGNFMWAHNYAAIHYNQGTSASLYKNGYVLFGTTSDTGDAIIGIDVILADSTAQSGCVTGNIDFLNAPFYMADSLINYSDTVFFNSSAYLYTIGSTTASLTTTCPSAPYSHYEPMLDSVNIWHYISDWFVVLPPPNGNNTKSLNNGCQYPIGGLQMEYTDEDTVIDGKKYRQLWDTDFYQQSCIEGFIREDTSLRKVFFRDNLGSSEIVIYDFSMQVGDSIHVSFYNQQSYSFFDSGWYLLDSVKGVQIMSGWRRQFYLHCQNCGSGRDIPLVWLESVGNLCELVYPYFVNQNGARSFYGCYEGGNGPGEGVQYSCVQFLSCFSHNQLMYFDSCAYQVGLTNDCSSQPDSCSYNGCGAIHNIPNLSSFTLYPNPTASQVTLKFDVTQGAVFDIAVMDMQGRQSLPTLHLGRLIEGIQTRVLDISALASGFYMIACNNSEGVIYRKLVVER